MPDRPSRNGPVTTACPVCAAPFRPVGRQQVCSAACRQALWRQRHPKPLPPRPARVATAYVCPGCDTSYLGQQRCEECGLFCRRVGPGGRCPHCDEPVAVADLLATSG